MRRMQSVLPRLLAGSFLVVALDQASKSFFSSHSAVSVVPGVLSFVVTHNPGIAFSLPVSGLPLIGLTVAVLVAFMIFFFQRVDVHAPVAQIAFALIVGGGLGNLVDRVAWGAVTDFISIASFPVFNLADAAVFFGAVVLAWKHPIIQRFPKKTNPTVP